MHPHHWPLTSQPLHPCRTEPLRVDALQDTIDHPHTPHWPGAIQLRGQPPLQMRASLSTFTACTVPASCRVRSRFLNLRDSVKKSPTKSTAKVAGGSRTAGRWQPPLVPFSLAKVPLLLTQDLQWHVANCTVAPRRL